MPTSNNSVSYEEAEALLSKAEQVGRNKPFKTQSELALSMELTIDQLKGRLKTARHIIKLKKNGEEDNYQTFHIKGLEKIQNREEMTADEIMEYAHTNWKRKKEKNDLINLIPVKFSKDVVTGICVWGDPHLDDGGTNWDALMDLMDILKEFDADRGSIDPIYSVNIGDSHNNWVGRLSLRYSSEQKMSKSQVYKVIEKIITEVNFILLLRGNHDMWQPSNIQYDKMEWFAQGVGTLAMDWRANIDFQFPNGVSVNADFRHDFPGHSMYNSLHGLQKANLFNTDADIYVAGHRHNYAKSELPSTRYVNGFSAPAHLLRVKGFKDIDSYADQGGFPRQDYGHAGLIVIDPLTNLQNRIQIYSDIRYGANVIRLLNADYRKRGLIK